MQCFLSFYWRLILICSGKKGKNTIVVEYFIEFFSFAQTNRVATFRPCFHNWHKLEQSDWLSFFYEWDVKTRFFNSSSVWSTHFHLYHVIDIFSSVFIKMNWRFYRFLSFFSFDRINQSDISDWILRTLRTLSDCYLDFFHKMIFSICLMTVSTVFRDIKDK